MRTAYLVVNGSDLPIYDVQVMLDGREPVQVGGMLLIPPHSREMIRPADLERYEHLSARWETPAVEFRDIAGITWLRDNYGTLTKVGDAPERITPSRDPARFEP